jgi:elongation factor Tu
MTIHSFQYILTRLELDHAEVMVRPGTITAQKKFMTQMYILTKEEGGRHTPFFENYQPQLYARTMDIPCTLFWPDTESGKKNREDNKMIMPGDNLELVVEMLAPVAVDEGLRFTVREGGKTVGTGVVTKVLS